MKLVLIGFMASGKTSVARAVSKRLNYPVVEVDELILQEAGLASIRDIFSNHGEGTFRELERNVIKSLADSKDVIISPGGGAILDEVNQMNLRAGGGYIVYLKVSFDTVLQRVKDASRSGQNDRPLLSDIDAARRLYMSRLDIYRTQADLTIDTDGRSVDEIADDLVVAVTRIPVK